MAVRIKLKLFNYWAVIPAAGSGSRLHADRPKQYLALLDQCVLGHGLRLFSGDSRFCGNLGEPAVYCKSRCCCRNPCCRQYRQCRTNGCLVQPVLPARARLAGRRPFYFESGSFISRLTHIFPPDPYCSRACFSAEYFFSGKFCYRRGADPVLLFCEPHASQ